MNQKTRRFPRRSLLRGLTLGAGASFLAPLTERFVSEAHGVTPTKKRLIVIGLGHGLSQQRYATTVRSPTDWDLPAPLAPLAAHKEDLTFLAKFYHPFGKELHGNDKHTLTVMPPIAPADWHGGISFDRYIAQVLGGNTAYSSLALTTAWFFGFGETVPISADGPGKPYPAEWNPLRAYETIFGPATPDGEPAAQRLARSANVLDFLSDDVSRVRSLLAGNERAKMDQYLESLSGLHRQLTLVNETREICGKPQIPLVDVEAAEKDCVIQDNLINASVVTGLIDVACHSLQCGMTNVVSLALQTGAPHTRLMDAANNHHDAWHANDQETITLYEHYYYGHVASLVQKLKDTPEGDGSMFDNTLVMVVNTGGGDHHGGSSTHPVLLLGNAGSSLATNRYLDFEQDAHCLSDVFVTAANVLDVPTETFGDPKHCQGVLPGVL